MAPLPSDILSNNRNDIPANPHDPAVAHEVYRFDRIHGLERTLEMRKAELEEILERVGPDQKKLKLDELFESLNAEGSQMKPNATNGQNTNLEGLEAACGGPISNRNYLYEWLGIAVVNKEDLGGLRIGESGLADVEVACGENHEEGAVNGLERVWKASDTL